MVIFHCYVSSPEGNSQNFDHLWFMTFCSSIVEYLLTLKGCARNMYTRLYKYRRCMIRDTVEYIWSTIIDYGYYIDIWIYYVHSVFAIARHLPFFFAFPDLAFQEPQKMRPDLPRRRFFSGSPNEFNWLFWVNYNDNTLFSLESWFILGESSPFMAELFRCVNYDNLPR